VSRRFVLIAATPWAGIDAARAEAGWQDAGAVLILVNSHMKLFHVSQK
jgi:hypothetical protein